PMLRLEAGGPTAFVTALAFAPDGKTLYAAGYDKVVRAWALEEGAFVPRREYRVPVGPGSAGVINALALSPDGRWLATGGMGLGAVRLWDVSAGKELARSDDLPDPGDQRPGLAAWHTGPGARDLCAALAWQDGRLRVWDVGRGRLRSAGADGRLDDTVVFL